MSERTILGYPWRMVAPVFPSEESKLGAAFVEYGGGERVPLVYEFVPNYGLHGLGLYARWPSSHRLGFAPSVSEATRDAVMRSFI